jgi:hypothetical protein
MLENVMFRILDLFPSSGKERETPTWLGLLERANLNYRIFITHTSHMAYTEPRDFTSLLG